MLPVSDTAVEVIRAGTADPATPCCTGRRWTHTARRWKDLRPCGSRPFGGGHRLMRETVAVGGDFSGCLDGSKAFPLEAGAPEGIW